MNKLHISPEAQNDLWEIRRYISKELENETAANSTLKKIMNRVRELETQALIGSPLTAVIPYETDYRYLVSGQYLIFYRVDNTDIYIIRIVYGRRDYLRLLFSELSDE